MGGGVLGGGIGWRFFSLMSEVAGKSQSRGWRSDGNGLNLPTIRIRDTGEAVSTPRIRSRRRNYNFREHDKRGNSKNDSHFRERNEKMGIIGEKNKRK